jgi:hypothetical protein
VTSIGGGSPPAPALDLTVTGKKASASAPSEGSGRLPPVLRLVLDHRYREGGQDRQEGQALHVEGAGAARHPGEDQAATAEEGEEGRDERARARPAPEHDGHRAGHGAWPSTLRKLRVLLR